MKLEENIFFLADKYTLKEYEAAMVKVVQSQDLQIGNQIRATYILNNTNSKKSKMVDFAYSVFLGTIVLSGIVSLFCNFISKI